MRSRGFSRDALGGEWRCTGAGTPGTWMQIRPAAVTADPSNGTISTGYLIVNVTTGHIKRHTGAYVWELPQAKGALRSTPQTITESPTEVRVQATHDGQVAAITPLNEIRAAVLKWGPIRDGV